MILNLSDGIAFSFPDFYPPTPRAFKFVFQTRKMLDLGVERLNIECFYLLCSHTFGFIFIVAMLSVMDGKN